jgi:hypothetical protein
MANVHDTRIRLSACVRLALAVILTFAGATSPAFAQPVPSHAPGTVCYTPSGWCWYAPGAPGEPCSCPTPQGYVAGRLG